MYFECFFHTSHFTCVTLFVLQIIPLDVESSTQRPPFYIAGWRLLLDVTFFILVTTIGLNIVSGIIVDTFSQLRNEKVHICMSRSPRAFQTVKYMLVGMNSYTKIVGF